VLLPGLSSSAAPTSRILSPRGTVLADPRTNQIFVTDIPSKLEEVAQLIAKIDKPVRQVMIEARIVEASDQFGRSLGVKLGFLNNNFRVLAAIHLESLFRVIISVSPSRLIKIMQPGNGNRLSVCQSSRVWFSW
jgi:Type II secretory pathway, component HofQ